MALFGKEEKTQSKPEVKTPWIKNLGNVPAHLEYFQGSMYDKVAEVARHYPNNIAYDFMGGKVRYKDFINKVDNCARALAAIGVKEGEAVTICMPNSPQAIIMFYAVNKIGGIANMVHPLSAEKEIENYLNMSNSVMVVTLDQFYHKIEAIRKNTKIQNVIIARIRDELTRPIRM